MVQGFHEGRLYVYIYIYISISITVQGFGFMQALLGFQVNRAQSFRALALLGISGVQDLRLRLMKSLGSGL